MPDTPNPPPCSPRCTGRLHYLPCPIAEEIADREYDER